MKNKLFRQNMKEVFTTPRLYASIGIIAVMFVLARELEFRVTSLIYMSMATLGGGQLRIAAYVIASFPYIITYCDDCTNQYILSIAARSGTKKYALSKYAASFISSFTALFCGLMLALAIESVHLPLSDIYNPENAILYGCFVDYGLPIMTVIAVVFQYALYGAVFGICGLTVSTVITNKFVTLVTPMVLYFTVNACRILPRWLNIDFLATVNWVFYIEGLEGTVINFVYAILFAAVLITGIYIIFRTLVERAVCENMRS